MRRCLAWCSAASDRASLPVQRPRAVLLATPSTLPGLQESDEEVRGLVERLKHDVDTVRASAGELQGASRSAGHLLERLEASGEEAGERMRELQEQVMGVGC